MSRDSRRLAAKSPEPNFPGEGRVIKRVRKRLMVRFSTGSGSGQRMAFTKNLSETGLFVRTNSIVKPGTTIQVQIQFPDRTISHWARVVWAKQVPAQLAHVLECGMGLSFVDSSPDWRAFFREWSGTS